MRTRIKHILIVLVLLTSLAIGQSDHVKYYEEFEYSCSTCHECKNPTKSNPCLKSCPRFDLITIHHSAEEAPENITLNFEYLGPDLYEEVIFTHKLHAEMSVIGGGCAMCHHNNPPGQILPCSNCHTLDRKRIDIDKPDLKGAYHRQCMDCHRKWEHEIVCESCHAKKASGKTEKVSHKKEVKKHVHPKVEEPTRIVFDTGADEGTKVTFFHNEHVSLFGLNCTDCHSNESCIHCHDTKESVSETIETEETHELCSPCHNVEDNCEYCHSNKVRTPFNHAKRTGFSLTKYHNKVTCKNCHGKDKTFKNISKKCISCHKTWNSENFNHKVTGITLDENHIENDCEDCHVDKNFAAKPSCEDCHDDISYPSKLPGKRIK